MGREIRRVPLDYEYDIDKIWPGFAYKCDGCEFKPAEEDEECEKVDECPRRYDPPTGDGYQIWETVSEGSPASKVFATKEELIEHLHKEGGTGIFKPCTRAAATHFVEAGWAPSMAIINGYSADGINAYSAGLPPFLHGFDCLSDEIIDELQGQADPEKITKLLTQFRDRTDKFTKIFEAAGRIYTAAKTFEGELPDSIKEAIKAFDDLSISLYGE